MGRPLATLRTEMGAGKDRAELTNWWIVVQRWVLYYRDKV